MNEPPLQYAGRDTPADDARRRTLGTWAMLLVIWSVGLLVWAFYIAGAVYLFFRIFS
jgi:hypothetical protein